MNDIISCFVDELDQYDGYYFASKIRDPQNGRLILRTNCQVSDRIIDALKNRGIDRVNISKDILKVDDECDDLVISKMEINKTKKALKDAFKDVSDFVMNQAPYKGFRNVNITKETVDKINDTMNKVVESILNNDTAVMYLGIIEEGDNYLLRHSASVTYMSLVLLSKSLTVRDIIRHNEKGLGRFAIGSNYKANNLVSLGTSCLLHDLGKVLIASSVNRDVRYGPDDENWEKIKRHPKIGHDLLFGKGIDAHALLGIKYHHENFDGTGYPYGIKEYKIHIYSRIIRIVDSFDAASTRRPGSEAKDTIQVLKEMKELSGKHYDPEILEEFIRLIEEQ